MEKELSAKQKLLAIQKLKKARKKTRDACKKHFWSFCLYMDNDFFKPRKKVLYPIANLFHKLYTDEYNRIAVSIHPRIGKSYITSLFVAWNFGMNPQGSVMRNATDKDLAVKFSKDTKRIMTGDKYRMIFPNVKFKRDSNAMEKWELETATQVSYFCAGVGGNITGYGANMLAITDDVFGKFKQAASEQERKSRVDWRMAEHQSRIEGNCKVIDIGTRWHSEDHFGYLDGLDYYDKMIKIPALDYKTGEATCPEFKSTEEWQDLMRITEDYIWEAEYQQTPIDIQGKLYNPEELNYYKRKEFKEYEASDGIMVVDTADKGTDFTTALSFRFLDGYYHLTDVVFHSGKAEETEPLIVRNIIANKVNKAQFETNREGRLYMLEVKRLLLEEGKKTNNYQNCRFYEKFNTQNKETRIMLAAQWITNNVKFKHKDDIVRGSMYDKFMRSIFSYMTKGKNLHDDSVDALAMFYKFLSTGVKQVKKETNVKKVLPKKRKYWTMNDRRF